MTSVGQVFFDKFSTCIESRQADGAYTVCFQFDFPPRSSLADAMLPYLITHFGIDSIKRAEEASPAGKGCRFDLQFSPEEADQARENTSQLMMTYFKAKRNAAIATLKASHLLDVPKPTRVPAAHGMGNGTG